MMASITFLKKETLKDNRSVFKSVDIIKLGNLKRQETVSQLSV